MVSPAIRLLIETELGHPIRYASDCETLSNAILTRTQCRIGITTLKRMLGFVNDVTAPRISTLDILARYLNYENFAELQAALGDDSDTLRLNDSDILISDTLAAGALVEIKLPCPAHKLKLRHITGAEYEVLSSTLDVISEGDHISIPVIATGASMTVSAHIGADGKKLRPLAVGYLHGVMNFNVMPQQPEKQ